MIKWFRNEIKFSNGYYGNLGKLKHVFYIGWPYNGGGWVLSTRLPGITINSPAETERKVLELKAEAALEHWLDAGGLTIKRVKTN